MKHPDRLVFTIRNIEQRVEETESGGDARGCSAVPEQIREGLPREWVE